MEQLFNGYSLDIAPGVFPLSTDSMALADFVRPGKNANILDLGSGGGTLGVLLCARNPGCTVTGVEISPAAHACAEDNIRRNALEDRLFSICADLRTIPSRFPAGSFDCCVSNPPYFDGGPASKTHPDARREDLCSLSDLFRAAQWALRWGGDLYLVHRPERLAGILHQACLHQLEPKRLCTLRHRPDSPISLILVACRKGAKPGLQWQELTLYNSDGSPTPACRAIYHL